MASNKTYIEKAIDKTLKAYEKTNMNFSNVDREDIEKLREKLYAMISGNESEYKEQVDSRIDQILVNYDEKQKEQLDKIEASLDDEQEVNVLGTIPVNSKLKRIYRKGIATGIGAAIVSVGVILAVSCGSTKGNTNAADIDKLEAIELSSVDLPEGTEEIKDENILTSFKEATSTNTITSLNNLLSNGVKLVEFDTLTEEQQKELMASMGLQYYLVANIDDITTLEYANFMKEQPNAIVDNDDLIYNFRNLNVLLKGQMLVSTPDNKIDFTSIYQNELDAKLLNDGADLIAKLNACETKKERKEVSKEFYEYIENTLLNSTSELKYSNSAMATFINVEFGAWSELVNSSYGYGYYPDDELEAKLMTVASTCGLSEGEKAELDLQDETKTSLESVNVIRIVNTLDERKENILTLNATGELYYIDGASFGSLKEEVIAGIDLTNYKEITSYTEKLEEEIKSTPAEKHKNDSGVSNGQGGTIAKDDMESHGVNPSSPNAKEEYEQAVKEEYKDNTVTKNEQGNVIDPAEATKWAQQGAIDANNSTKNNNVPAIYQDAYNSGWNAANEAKKQAEQNVSSSTTFVPETNGTTSSTVTEETYEGFKETNVQTPNTNTSNGNSQTTFIPVGDGEVEEEIIEETIVGFDSAYAPRTVEVKTLTRNKKIQSYNELKLLIQEISNNFDIASQIYNEMNEATNNMTR